MISQKNIVADPKFIVIDLFCGAGGTTTGFDMAMINGQKAAFIAACVNHDPLAIESHWQNHPDVLHFLEDITKLYGHVVNGILFQTDHMKQLVRLTDIYRAMYPNAKIILWASLECTNFSKAKGGMARDADSRTLADHLDRYVAALDPDYIQIENVVEFMSWGPMLNGKPVSKKNGQDWIRWKQHLCSFGYRDEWKGLNSADFGAYTSRNRLFGVFAKPGLPIIWPQPSHSKKPSSGSMFGDLKKWKAVKEVLDFEDEGLTIFNRKTALVDPSLQRLEAGLVKFIAGGEDSFMVQYNSGSVDNRVINVNNPCNAIPTSNRFALAQTSFIAKYCSGKADNHIQTIDNPAGTLTCVDHHSIINTSFIAQRNSGNPKSKLVSIDGPARTLTSTAGNQEVIQCHSIPFLVKYHGSGLNISSIESPASTLSTKDRLAKIQPVWFDKTFTGVANIASVDSPAGTIMPNDKHRLVQCDTLSDLKSEVIVLHESISKEAIYHIQYKDFPFVFIPVHAGDSEVMIRIKNFMALYGIADIKMRMLKVLELLKIQGFPANYVLAGNQSDQKKFIGNSVVPHVVRAWTEAMVNGNRNIQKVA